MTSPGDGETGASVLAARDGLSRPGVVSVVATGSPTAGDFRLFRGTFAAGKEIAPGTRGGASCSSCSRSAGRAES